MKTPAHSNAKPPRSPRRRFSGHPSPGEKRARKPSLAPRLVRNVALWLLPCVLVWLAITPFYNRFLTVSAENLLHLVESPDVTRLLPKEDAAYITITRSDFPASRPNLYQVRVTDIHFNLFLLTALFLAMPGVPMKQRLGNLSWALLISVFFHIVLLFLWVKFVYATQLGDWSTAHYGEFGYNFFGMAKHLLDLPFKLALPLALWSLFYLRALLPQRDSV